MGTPGWQARVVSIVLTIAAAEPAAAGFGSNLQATGRFGLGLVGRSFNRSVYDVRRDQLSNPDDSWGYLALEVRLGLWDDRLDLGMEFGRAHNSEDDFPDRDYITHELGTTLRGVVAGAADGRWQLTGGAHYRDTIGFDRGATLTHKLRRHWVVFGLYRARVDLYGRAAYLYGGPLWSQHQFFDYGASYSPTRGPGRGETRQNLLALGGLTLKLGPSEAGLELAYRDALSYSGSWMFHF